MFPLVDGSVSMSVMGLAALPLAGLCLCTAAPGCALLDASRNESADALYGARQDIDLPGATAIAVGNAEGSATDQVLVATDSRRLVDIVDGEIRDVLALPAELVLMRAANLDGDSYLDLVGLSDRQVVIIEDVPRTVLGGRSISTIDMELPDMELAIFSGYSPGLAIGDLNRDGLPDIALGGGDGTFGVLFQDSSGDGQFPASLQAVESGTIDSATYIVITDQNGDGANDLVYLEPFFTMAVLRQTSPGRFSPRATIDATEPSLVDGPVGLGTFDLDSSGRDELVVSFGKHLGVYGSVSGGAQGPLTKLQTLAGAFGEHLSAADVSDDGLLDLVVSGNDEDELLVFEQRPGLKFKGPVQRLALPGRLKGLAMGSLTSARATDVAALTASGVSIFEPVGQP